MLTATEIRAKLRFLKALEDHLRYNFVPPIDTERWEGPAKRAIEAVAEGDEGRMIFNDKTAGEIVDGLRLEDFIEILPPPS